MPCLTYLGLAVNACALAVDDLALNIIAVVVVGLNELCEIGHFTGNIKCYRQQNVRFRCPQSDYKLKVKRRLDT